MKNKGKEWDLLNKLNEEEDLTPDEIATLLESKDKEAEERLFYLANEKRKKYVGDEVHIRGLI